MDESSNEPYSRAPEFEDLLRLCQSLNQEKVRYLVIGGFAVILHGSVRATKDIDLLVDSSQTNIKKIKQAMSSLPDNAIALIAEDEVKKYQVVRVADEFVVDLMEKACGIDYKIAEKEIDWKEIEGIKIPLASKSLLIRMKDTVRPSDKADVEFLKWRIQAEKELKNKGEK